MFTIAIRSTTNSSPHEIEFWVDTGFNGDLVLPNGYIETLGFVETGTVEAALADGSQVKLPVFQCLIDWFGESRELEVIANNGAYPLLGVGLLKNRNLNINYRESTVTIN